VRWYRLPSFEEHENPEPDAQDVELRRLVDLLPPVQRHLINRTFFGGTFLSVAARELGLEKRAARTLRDEGLAQLKEWLEDPPDEDPPLEESLADDPLIWRCAYTHSEWGDCQQPAMVGDIVCAFHAEFGEARHPSPPPVRQARTETMRARSGQQQVDDSYERAVIEGRIQPVQARLTKSEMDSLIGGRYRGDGRRLDIYTVADPIEMGDWT
jgi:hypothetical protein